MRLTGLPYGLLQQGTFRLLAQIFFFAEDEAETIVVEEFIRGEILSDWLKQPRYKAVEFDIARRLDSDDRLRRGAAVQSARRFQSVDEIKTALRLEQFSYWGKIFAAIFFTIKILMSFHRISNDAKNLPFRRKQDVRPLILALFLMGF